MVVGSVIDGLRAGATELSVTLNCHGQARGRTVTTSHECERATDRSIERDRVLVTGGRVIEAHGQSSRFEAWLP